MKRKALHDLKAEGSNPTRTSVRLTLPKGTKWSRLELWGDQFWWKVLWSNGKEGLHDKKSWGFKPHKDQCQTLRFLKEQTGADWSCGGISFDGKCRGLMELKEGTSWSERWRVQTLPEPVLLHHWATCFIPLLHPSTKESKISHLHLQLHSRGPLSWH